MSRFNRLIPKPIKRLLKQKLTSFVGLPHEYATLSFAQEGEDLVLARLFDLTEVATPGFYVDVGAHHPKRFSNTYYFYLRSWCGINIDPLPGSMNSFEYVRPNDTNLETAISDAEAVLTYYEFNEPALNGFSEAAAIRRDNYKHFKLVSTRQIQTRRLSQVLDQYLPIGIDINFLSVDVEGHDINVLKSNDWAKYRPKIVLVEDAEVATIEDAKLSEVADYMRNQGYEFLSKTALTLFFAEPRFIHRGETGVRIL